jgi:hypothetical protein
MGYPTVFPDGRFYANDVNQKIAAAFDNEGNKRLDQDTNMSVNYSCVVYIRTFR